MVRLTRMFPNTAQFRGFIVLTMVIALLASAMPASLAVYAQNNEHALASAAPASTVIYAEVDLDQSSAQWTLAYDLVDRAGLNDVSEEETGSSVEEIGESAEDQFAGELLLV